VALANIMRLSSKKGAHLALSSAAWQEIWVRFGRDDKGEGGAPMGERPRTKGVFFITLGGPQAHDSSGRDDKFWVGSRVEKLKVEREKGKKQTPKRANDARFGMTGLWGGAAGWE